ncbi:hypothetical protein ACFLWR_04665 [Chloroflexota bacterium]
MNLERIIMDADEKEAPLFLKKSIYDRIAHTQLGRLKSHLDTGRDSTQNFVSNT